jgi:CheY-like chemotaxis protein
MTVDTEASPSERRLQVLVVDDNRDAADTLSMVLRLWGYETRVAYDGASALEVARAFIPDCLVLDIGLPILNGYSVAERVRQMPGLEKTKLIALTAYSDEAHVRRAREVGFDHHLVKPPDLAELERILKMLNEVLRLTTKTEELARRNVELATQTNQLLREVKEELREVKEELREIKEGNAEEHPDKQPGDHH